MAKFLVDTLLSSVVFDGFKSRYWLEVFTVEEFPSRTQAILDLASENKPQSTGINAAIVIWLVNVLESLILAHSIVIKRGSELLLGILASQIPRPHLRLSPEVEKYIVVGDILGIFSVGVIYKISEPAWLRPSLR